MSTQPTAIDYATNLEARGFHAEAAELRRLHAETHQLREQNTALDAACAKMEAVRGTQPTDDEINALIVSNLLVVDGGQCAFESWVDMRPELVQFARAVLAKWGTPATGGEPVAWMDDFGNAFPLAANKGAGSWMDAHTRTWKPLYTSPQPVREPLTQPEVVEGFCKEPHSVQYVSVFSAGVRFAERHHGITGGQHE